tara:strand:+ start:175 stop:483 length:309 start_codon:yes stop_codon:yes gene_type:complete
MDYEKIKNEIQKFVDDRNWEQSHTPKNLAMALSVEASELVEIFTWQKEDEYLNRDKKVIKNKTQDELVDIFYYIIRICQKMDINLEKAFYKKMKKNYLKHSI